MEAILHELVDCEERKTRKRLVKQALELLAAPVAEQVVVVEANKAKKSKKEREPVVAEAVAVVAVVEEEAAAEEPKKDKKKKKRDLEVAQETDKAAVAAQDDSFVNGNGNEDYPEEKKRFSRIKDEQKSFQDALIQDNTYDAVFAGTGYGAKANDKLKTVRGKDFRHEKTKKKRGSYRGGAIDDEVVNSVEFSD